VRAKLLATRLCSSDGRRVRKLALRAPESSHLAALQREQCRSKMFGELLDVLFDAVGWNSARTKHSDCPTHVVAEHLGRARLERAREKRDVKSMRLPCRLGGRDRRTGQPIRMFEKRVVGDCLRDILLRRNKFSLQDEAGL